MSEIIEHTDNNKETSVNVGEGQSQVSVKVYQDVYHQVTGRTEQIKKRYSNNLLVDFPELEQLHHKVLQLCDVHNVLAHNETISVFHEKERKEQFTSFDRFRAYNSNCTSPTINIVMKYNFAIIPAGVKRPQEYTVTVRLTSRVAALNEMKEEIPAFMRGQLLGLIGKNTAEVTIDYADYVIARGFIEAIDEWVAGCKTTPTIKLIKLVQNYSHTFPSATQLAVAALMTYFGLQSIPSFFSSDTSPHIWPRFFIIYIGGFYILTKLGRTVGALIEEAIDSYPEISYLHLNRGDKNLADKANNSKPWIILRTILSIAGALALAVVASKLEKLI